MVGDIFQPTHLLFVLVVALLVLGPKKLPEVGRQLGNGIRDFRAAINGERSEPEEVQAPYEQAVTDPAPVHEFTHEQPTPDTGPEHEFAHEQPTPDTAPEHEFAHEQPDPVTAAPHEFAHAPVTEATTTGHEFAHEPDTAAAAADAEAPHSAQPDIGHEFAYGTSETADRRTDPPA